MLLGSELISYSSFFLIILFNLLLLGTYSSSVSLIGSLSYPSVLLQLLTSTVFVLAFYITLPYCFSDLSVNIAVNGLTTNLFSLLSSNSLIFISVFVLLITSVFINTNSSFMFEYDLLLVLSILALFILVFSSDLLVIYLAIELQALSSYGLIAIHNDSEFSLEASVNYFVLGALASCFLLFGFSIIYYSFGTLSLVHILNLSTFSLWNTISDLGIAFSILAILFNLGVAPLHIWLCDVYEGSVTPLMLYFSTIPNISLLSLLINLVLLTFANFYYVWGYMLWSCGIISILWSSLAAIYQRKLNRLLAYSSVGHIGFISLALSCNSPYSLNATFIYISLYIMINLLVFSLITSTLTNDAFPKFIINWLSLASNSLWFASLFSLSLFAVAGIPPLSGFYMNLSVIFTLIDSGFLTTSLIIVILSCISAFYYLRLIKLVFFFNESKQNLWADFSGSSYISCFFASITIFSIAYLNPLESLGLLLTLLSV